jgi:cyanophycinase
MLRSMLAAALASIAVACASTASRAPAPRGHLVIVGGGNFGDEVVARALELSGGANAHVVVLPQASELADRGEDAAKMWREAGAAEVTNLVDLSDGARARELLGRADLIWLGGGDQTRLMAALRDAQLIELVRERYRSGATVAGTSAGAAVMSAHMLTGEGDDALVRIARGTTQTAEGLGLFAGAIVDQHFVRRQRNNRLLSVVLEHPSEVGFGIDERTAAVVSGSRIDVLGPGAVVVFDARHATVEPTEPNAQAAARDLELHVLRGGMFFDLAR